MVAGFHSLDLVALSLARSAASTGSVGRRRGLGIREVQKEGVATRGRLDSEVERRGVVVVYCRRIDCCLAHAAHIFWSGRMALDGAISDTFVYLQY